MDQTRQQKWLELYKRNRAIFNSLSKVNRGCMGFTSLRPMIGPVKLEPLSQPIRFKTIETNRDSVAHVFPRFRHWGFIYLEFPLVLKGYFLSIHLPLWLLWFWFLDSQSKGTRFWEVSQQDILIFHKKLWKKKYLTKNKKFIMIIPQVRRKLLLRIEQ